MTVSETGAVFYLTVPLFLFCALFLVWPLALVTCAVVGYCLFNVARQTNWTLRFAWSDLALFLIAVAWTTLAGITPFMMQNSDWLKHYSVLNLLVEQPWPAKFGDLYLRYGLGYYLVPALLAKPLNFAALEWFLGLWTTVGVWLSLRLFSARSGGFKAILIFGLVFVFFSGMDFVGYKITGIEIGPTWHLEWWNGLNQIPSTTTSLFWAPQHALPAWICTSIILNQGTAFPRHIGIAFTAATFWSPLAVVGLVPFGILSIAQNFRRSLTPENFLAIIPLIVVAIYLVSGSSNIPLLWIWDSPYFALWRYLLSVVLEWGLLSVALIHAGADRTLVLLSAISLLFLSMIQFGGAGDLLMRASAPAILVLAFLVANSLRTKYLTPVLAIFLLGLPTSIGEFRRALAGSRFDLSAASFSHNEMVGYQYQYLTSPAPIGIREPK